MGFGYKHLWAPHVNGLEHKTDIGAARDFLHSASADPTSDIVPRSVQIDETENHLSDVKCLMGTLSALIT